MRRAMSRLGIRYRMNVRSLPGAPDLASVRLRLAIFVHGCFWHRHRGCRRTTDPKRNSEFWTEKFADNVARDRRNVRLLRQRGFRVLIVWECETEAPEFEAKLEAALARLRCTPT